MQVTDTTAAAQAPADTPAVLQAADSALERVDSALAAVTGPFGIVLDAVYLGNPVRAWLLAAAVFATVLGALILLRSVVTGRMQRIAERTDTQVDNYVLTLLRHTRYSFMVFVALALALLSLSLPGQTKEWIRQLGGLIVIIQIGLWANELISLYLQRMVADRAATDAASVTTIRAMGMVARLVLWVVVFLLVLENFGVDVTALVTGLGIAGVAVALAVQNVLGDLLASLSIVLDKPFRVGDFIIVDTYMGTVEEVGLKTTRVRSLGGEQLIFSNTDLLKARVRNFKRMQERRILFGFGVEYGTPPEKLEQIAATVKEVIEAQELTRFDRSHFFRFGPASLDFEVVYYVLSPDYGPYMDVQQRINLELMRRLRAMDVSFAFPTQTIYLRREADASGAGADGRIEPQRAIAEPRG